MDKIKSFWNSIVSLWNSFVKSLKENKEFRIKAIIIGAVAVVVIAGIIIACVCAGGNQQNTESSDPSTQSTASSQTDAPDGMMDFCVTVIDGKGEPVPGVIVNFMRDGSVAGMQQTDADGVAVKKLAGGEYTIELAFTDSSVNYTYDTESAVVSVDSSTVTIVLYNAVNEEVKELYAYSAETGEHKAYNAYYVTEGSSVVILDTTDRNYFIFVPSRDGIYQFSADDASVQIGYYGSTYFVQASSLAENNEDGSFSIDIAPSMVNVGSETGTMAMVIGLDSATSTQCVFTIERIGEHVMSMDEYPWTVYETTAQLSKFELPEGINLIDFDITESSETYELVYNEMDGFYHLDSADGPLVYVKLGVESAYLDSLQAIIENSGINRYFFDEEGNFLSKESYTECLMEYMENMDETAGIYPLTEDLKYIIQQRGEYVGWWNPDSMTYIFCDDEGKSIIGLNTDIAWLFICCYGEEIPEVIETEPAEPDTGKENTSGSTNTSTDSSASSNKDEDKQSSSGSTNKDEDKQNNSGSTNKDEDKQNNSGSTNKEEDKQNSSGSTNKDEDKQSSSGSTNKDEDKQNNSGSSNKDEDQESSTKPTESTESTEATQPETSEPETVEIYYHEIAGTMSTDLTVKAGEYANIDFYKLSNMIITIKSENAYILYDNEVCLPVDGVLAFVLKYEQNNVSSPCSLKIGNSGSKDETFTISFSVIPGTINNPVELSTGSFTTLTRDGDSQGYYYSYTATKDGVLTISFESISIKETCVITMTNMSSCVQNSVEDGTVSINVKAGESVQIIVAVIDSSYTFPAATIIATASFE